VRIGTDAALCLGICQVVIDEGCTTIASSGADRPAAARPAGQRSVSARQRSREDGREDQFFYDSETSRSRAPRKRWPWRHRTALEGRYEATLKDGERRRGCAVFALLKKRLEGEYTRDRPPPSAASIPT
jgi:hypothetical protein